MTPSELKYNIEQSENAPYYFTRSSIKFFGDTMKNYGCRFAWVEHNTSGKTVECWELYRKHLVKHGNQSSAYFDKQSFKRVFPAKGVM